jgi:hypothetical protein
MTEDAIRREAARMGVEIRDDLVERARAADLEEPRRVELEAAETDAAAAAVVD